MIKQKQINKMLNNIRTQRSFYNTYGKVLKISLFHILAFVDIFIPSFRLLTLLGYKYKHIEICRITIKK